MIRNRRSATTRDDRDITSPCPACKGEATRRCAECDGEGSIMQECDLGHEHESPCDDCGGEGSIHCDRCRGFGCLDAARADAEQAAWRCCPPAVVRWLVKHAWRPMAGDGPMGDSGGEHSAITVRLRPTDEERAEMTALGMVRTGWADAARPGVEEWQWSNTPRALKTRANAPLLEVTP